jgi:SMC interacting uncharacterized protein involved in chromosome segregation
MVKTQDPNKALDQLTKHVSKIQTWIDRSGEPLQKQVNKATDEVKKVKDIDEGHGKLEKQVGDIQKAADGNKAWIDRNGATIQGFMNTACSSIEKLESKCTKLEKNVASLQKDLATLKKKK